MDSFAKFLTDIQRAWWVYAGMTIPALETFLVKFGSPAPVLSTMRTLLGLFVLGFLPGFLTVRTLFPNDMMPRLEVVLLSVFLSLVISVGTGIGLGLGPFFIPVNVSLALTVYSVLFALGAGYRNFSSKRKSQAQPPAPVTERARPH